MSFIYKKIINGNVYNAYQKYWENDKNGLCVAENYDSIGNIISLFYSFNFEYEFQKIISLNVDQYIDLYHLVLYDPKDSSIHNFYNKISLSDSIDIINDYLKKVLK